ncbi:MAG: hypothetical protein JWQ30_2612 [Sediminibacterium sp.]|nr:hypothetical protein [Sediminibacterium sp.]
MLRNNTSPFFLRSMRKAAAMAAGILLIQTVHAQTVPVGMIGFDDQLRILQLQGKLDLNHSMMARPFFSDRSLTVDSIFRLTDSTTLYRPVRRNLGEGKGKVEVLPFHWYTKFNSDHPYSWNQAGFIQAKGLQTIVSTGVYVSSGWFNMQFKPEFVYAANPDFSHNASYGAPTRGNYHHFFMGQSSLRVTKGGISLGLSTENLWWGPGIHNSLLMSNNAPGFAHLTFNTTRPIKTPIGNFEWQLIAGKLVEDTSVLLENKNLTTGYYNPESYDGSGYSGPYNPKDKWRYLSGVTLTYNPKWIKGLFLSVTRVGYTYNFKLKENADGYSFFKKYFPVLFGVLRQDYPYGTPTANHDIGVKQMASLAARFVFPESHTELYTEYGYGDNFLNLRDWNNDAPHSTTYLLGIRKLKKLNKETWLDVGAELTHMAESVNYLVRTAGDWYGYQGGYTQQGRILGAGVGKGNNAYTLNVHLLSGFSKVGMVIQGIQHAPTELVTGFANFGLRETKWNDLAFGLTGQKKYNNVILHGELQAVNTQNFAWEKGNNRFNLYCFLSVSYLW